MKSVLSISTALAALLIAGTALADTPRLDDRQANQRARIVDGVQSGELTRPETAHLVKGQSQLRRMERRAESDGTVTAKERVRLQHSANKQSRRIARSKHNDRSRG